MDNNASWDAQATRLRSLPVTDGHLKSASRAPGRYVQSQPVALPGSRRPYVNPWLGALFVLVLSCLYAFALPALSNAVTGVGRLAAGEPFQVVEGLEITPLDGWRVESSGERLTTLTKGGASLVFAPVGPRRDIHDEIEIATAAFDSDPNADWDVAPAREFSTDAGDRAWAIEASSPSTSQVNWFVVHGGSEANIVGTSPDSVWSTVSDEMDQIVRSVVFTDTGT